MGLLPAINAESKFFLETNGEFECVQRIEPEAAADKWGVVGDLVRFGDIEPELIGDKMFQSRFQLVEFAV